MASFDTILISGRGEVASRIERTCKRIGIDIVDAEVPAGPHPFRPDTEATVAAAKDAGAQAIHPGYVGPQARAELALLTRGAELTFAGPSSEALAVMADKLMLRERARSIGLRVIEGSPQPVASVAEARAAAETIGYPVLIKPVAGTAGVGIRRAVDADELSAAFDLSSEEALACFGDGRLYLERMLYRPRHLEVTVVADEQGTRSALRERDCSVQRRNQVLIAETPSPFLIALADGEAVRELLIDQAIRLAEEVSLVGVMTVEFLVDVEGRVFFLEANADMQGAVLVTEMLTGVDPIELTLTIAAGEPLLEENRLLPHGHAFEVRLCAEDAEDGFRATLGRVDELRFPPAPFGRVRFDAAVEIGEEVVDTIEPLVARIATFAPVRHDALLALDRTLAETRIGPVKSNAAFLRAVLNDEGFRAGQYDVAFTEMLVAK